jgi:hypothetical protein
MKPNIIIIGVGHSGTSILSKMIGRMGWNLNDADEKFGESVSVRNINDFLWQNKSLDSKDFIKCLSNFKQPWVIKDPRFCETLHHWTEHMQEYKPLLIWITRDRGSIEKSYTRRGEGEILRGVTREQNLKNVAKQFQQWPWSKIKISLEDLTNAIKLFDTQRPYQ